MIQAAHVGIGIEGREGRQAALAADFSMQQFAHLGRLVLWHGRNCYLRSATLSQFVIHRGLIISVIQVLDSTQMRLMDRLPPYSAFRSTPGGFLGALLFCAHRAVIPLRRASYGVRMPILTAPQPL